MLWISDERTNSADFIIDKIENEMVGLQVIATQNWHIPIDKQKVTYTISSQRKITVLEEFIIKAALLNTTEAMNKSLLSSLFGLDEIFIDTCVEYLISKNVIEKTALPNINITETGMKFFKRGMIPDSETTETIEYYIDRKFGMFYTKPVQDDTCGVYENYEFINRKIDNIKKFITRDLIVNVGKEQGKVIEHPEMGKYITSFVSAQTIEKNETLMSEIWVYDVVEDIVFCRIWDHSKGIFRADIAEFIQNNTATKLSVNRAEDLFGVANNIKKLLIKSRTENIEEPTEQRQTLIKVFRGKNIKPVFEKSLELPKEQIIIISPWINESVVDRKFIKKLKELALKNVRIIIGWGFDDALENEKRPVSSNLANELLDVKNHQGIPMVCLVYLGNKHEKEIIIDNEIHIAGSFNWLSYRGDYRPRGEFIYYIQDSEIVINQRIFWENEFISAVKMNAIKSNNIKQLIAELNFLYYSLRADEFGELYENITSEALEEKSIDILYELAVFCIINKLYIFKGVSFICELLSHGKFSKKVKPILSYLKYHQPQDFKDLCDNHYSLLAQELGQGFKDFKSDEYKNITFQ